MAVAMLWGCGEDVEPFDPGSGGAGGAGGSELCPVPPCANADGVNCDPACGDVHPMCGGICTGSASVHFLPSGPTEIRLPPASSLELQCEDACDVPFTTLALALPTFADCVTVDGPIGMRIDVVDGIDPTPICAPTTPTVGCTTLSLVGKSEPRLVLSFDDGAAYGALVTVTPMAADCPAPVCAGGCNGAGG